jgi:hypothetical protein
MTIRCRYCQAEIELNPDTEEFRKAKTDPAQQLRDHIASHSGVNSLEHIRRTEWLYDRLFFECPEQPNLWREKLIRLLDAYLEGKL